MENFYQGLQPDQDINVIVQALRPQMLLGAHIMRDTESGFPNSRAGKDGNPQPGGSSASPITASSNSSSPGLLPALQLSASTISGSDFLSASDRSNPGLPRDHDSRIKTPSLYAGPVLDSWAATSGPEYEAAKQRRGEAVMPRVLEASKRLQQIMGLRNDDEFEPPTPPVQPGGGMVPVGNAVAFNPALRHLRGFTANLDVQIKEAGHERVKTGREAAEAATEKEKLRQVTKVAKPGLRESLLMHGRQPYGNRARTELRSISFYELAPDQRTGRGFRSELLAHFEADVDFRTRLVCYEISVPVSRLLHPINVPNGSIPNPQLPQTEPWLGLLISTPLLTFKSDTIPVAPANFPSQMPTSWVMFAAPCRTIYSYPPTKDIIFDRSPNGSEILREIKRFDYDFSHDGIPAFEFMNKSLALGVLGTHLERAIDGPFLSAKGAPGYEPGYDMINKPRGYGVDENGEEEDEDVLIERDLERWEDRENMDREMTNSKWWQEVGKMFERDRNTWVRIRDCMGRGRCRVVLRVDESLEQRMGGPTSQTSMGMGEEPWTAPDSMDYDPDMRKLPGLAQTFAATEASGAARGMGGGRQ